MILPHIKRDSTILVWCILVVIFVVVILIDRKLISPRFSYDTSSDLNKFASHQQTDNYTAISGLPNLNRDLNAKVISSDSFDQLIATAKAHPRKRRMVDLTKDPLTSSMQSLLNVWYNGSYSPVHKHANFSETFVVLQGALAFFVFSEDGSNIQCHILHDGSFSRPGTTANPKKSFIAVPNSRAIIIEKGQYHAMTAAPMEFGWPGYAVVFETSNHRYDPSLPKKTMASFSPVFDGGRNGDPHYFSQILSLCPHLNQ